MSLGKHLIERLMLLQQQGEQRPVAVEGQDASYFSVGAWQGAERAVVEFRDQDRFSVTLRGLEVGGRASVGHHEQFLRERGQALATRLSYLEEPLGIWELSTADGAVQLRSRQPHFEHGVTSYWEVLLRTGGQQPVARLTRYTWWPGAHDRFVVEYPATFSLLGRLADDIATALGT